MQQLLELIYSNLEIERLVNEGDLWGAFVFIMILLPSLSGVITALRSKPDVISSEPAAKPLAEPAKPRAEKEEKVEVSEEKPTELPKISFTERLKKGLSQTQKDVWGKLGNIISGKVLDDDTLEEIEEILYGADLGPGAVSELLQSIEGELKGKNADLAVVKEIIFKYLKEKMSPIQEKVNGSLYEFSGSTGKTKTIMVVGVNGAGKTTTIGKLATKLKNQGANVVVGACDTFRAAAVDQLQVWCDRAGVEMVRAKEGANPTGVAYDALQAAQNKKADYCILDTAGRLHTKTNLMEELAKSKNVLKKLDENAPDQVLLVIDAITGQNALKQAQEFNETLKVDGLIFTKCDGSSKAGSAVGIVSELKVPIAYIGVGEQVEDLDVFNLDDYLHALLG